jgi:hypothetical protein
MALRLIELFLPEDHSKFVQELLKDHHALGIWYEKLSEGKILVRVLLSAEETEAMMDLFEKHFSIVDGFRIILLPVEASIPRPEPSEEEKPPEYGEIQPEQPAETKIGRVSREELYNDISDSAKTTKTYIIMVSLSSIVAAIGLLRGNVAVTIGAMVIAPLIWSKCVFISCYHAWGCRISSKFVKNKHDRHTHCFYPFCFIRIYFYS